MCATRYKYFNKKGEILQVKCPNKCGQPDSLQHMIECYNLQPPQAEDTFEEKVRRLKEMATKTAKNCPIMPVPLEPEEIGEVELELEELTNNGSAEAQPPSGTAPSSSLGVSLIDALEFDEDLP